MAKLVIHSATLKCSEGMATSTLALLPTNGAASDEKAVATVMDAQALVNVAAFGMCKTLMNPQVAAATSAANGAHTPMPCQPLIVGPWSPGSSGVSIGDHKALTADSTCKCAWSGTISITQPQGAVEVE